MRARDDAHERLPRDEQLARLKLSVEIPDTRPPQTLLARLRRAGMIDEKLSPGVRPSARVNIW